MPGPRLDGKVALITGAAGGIGSAAARRFVSAGAQLLLTDAREICGAVSQHNATEGVKGPDNYLALLVARTSMIGMVVFDYADRYAQAATEIAGWMRERLIVSREEVNDGGIDACHDTLLRLFTGENTGKLALSVGGG